MNTFYSWFALGIVFGLFAGLVLSHTAAIMAKRIAERAQFHLEESQRKYDEAQRLFDEVTEISKKAIAHAVSAGELYNQAVAINKGGRREQF